MFTVLFGLFLLSFSAGEDWPGKRNKQKMEKEASKIWKETSYSVHELKDLNKKFTESYKTIYKIQENNKTLGYAYIGRVNTCRPGGCSAPAKNNFTGGNYEFFDYLLILDKSLAVKQVEILNYNATHGYEISSKRWLKQFLGYEGNKTIKYGKDIQAISGATISANSITDDIENTVNKLKTLKKQKHL